MSATKRLKNDFNKKATHNKDVYYDLHEDWDLISASFTKQYGIRLRNDKDMPWTEFASLLSGLMNDTPLGQIVEIRAEKDMKVIKKFNAEQKRIHTEWRTRQAKAKVKDKETLAREMNEMERMLSKMFGGRK